MLYDPQNDLNVLCAAMQIRLIIFLLPVSGAIFGYLATRLLSRFLFFPVAPRVNLRFPCPRFDTRSAEKRRTRTDCGHQREIPAA